jgi:hypothetical protein
LFPICLYTGVRQRRYEVKGDSFRREDRHHAINVFAAKRVNPIVYSLPNFSCPIDRFISVAIVLSPVLH